MTAPPGQVVAGQIDGSPMYPAQGMQPGLDSGAQPGVVQAPARPMGIYAYAEGSSNKVDRLVQRGFRPVGCVNGRFGFRSPEGFFTSVSTQELRASDVGDIIKCRNA